MTPVDIGDTQGTLQAKKMFETLYKRSETLVWVYTKIVFWMTENCLNIQILMCWFMEPSSLFIFDVTYF